MNSHETYKRFARYYDLYVGDFQTDLPLYKSMCGPAQHILEIGCGTGRVLRALLEEGCRVTGVDISDDMLRVAGAKLCEHLAQGTLVLKNHDFRCAPLQEQYDRIPVTFYTFNYLLTASERKQFLQNVHHCLAASGLVLIDLFYPQSLADPATSDQWQDSVLPVAGREIALRQKRRMLGSIEERIQIFTDATHQDEIVTRRRFLNKKQMDILLAEAGFQGRQFSDGYSLSTLRPLAKAEKTRSAFVCMASKSAQVSGYGA